MISGRVEQTGTIYGHPVLEPRVAIAIAAAQAGFFRTIDAAVDTGFTGWLTLPEDIIRSLGMQFRGRRRVVLADGREHWTDLYLGFLKWRGLILPRLVHHSESKPLVGMGLLTGYRLTVDAVPDGDVTIDEIRSG